MTVRERIRERIRIDSIFCNIILKLVILFNMIYIQIIAMIYM
jgi:hypothetical protein